MLVVVGGHSRGVGKTSVITALIRALPEARWTAVKISPHLHDAPGPALRAETDATGRGDSSRYLAAGAVRSFWLRAPAATAADVLGNILAPGENTIIESNSGLDFLQPDLCVAVIDPAVPEVKQSARTLLQRADAVVIVDRGAAEPAGVAGKLLFRVQPPEYGSAALVEFVRGLLR